MLEVVGGVEWFFDAGVIGWGWMGLDGWLYGQVYEG
jgi:hypothetical protein